MARAAFRAGRRWSVLLALALGLATAGATGAAADVFEGTGLVVAKDLKERTVTLMPDRVLHLDGQTRILDADGGFLPLVALTVARRVGGGAEADGDAMVRYRAERRGGKLVAERIRVLGTVPR